MSRTTREAMSWDDHRPSARLEGRRILVTGAASGIGKRTAEIFAEEGAKLALVDLTADSLREVAATTGGTPLAVDITDEPAVERAAATAAKAMGGIDGIVNAAGIGLGGKILDMDVATYRRVIDVNLTGTYIVIRACLARLREAKTATVVNLASATGLLPNVPGLSAYAASKGGVANVTRALAAEFAPSIRVNSVCPGLVATPMTKDGWRGDVNRYALRRVTSPLEIAQVILFLTGDASSFMTGTAIAADGGRTFH